MSFISFLSPVFAPIFAQFSKKPANKKIIPTEETYSSPATSMIVLSPQLAISAAATLRRNSIQECPPPAEPPPPPTVIVVDDSIVCRKTVKKILENIGYNVYEAENGEECISKMKNNKINMVIMDDDMPIMNGRKAAFLLRQQGYKKLIIGLTGEHRTEEHQKYIDSGADFVLTKPLDIKMLEKLCGGGSGCGSAAAARGEASDGSYTHII